MSGLRADRLRMAGLVLAVLGIGVAAYLTYVHYEDVKPICGLGGDCEKVQTSEWAKLLGIPVAVLGLAGYVVILGALLVDGELGRMVAAITSVVGFGFSMYLTYREIWTIEAICQWCVASAVLLTLLAVLTCVRYVRGAPPPPPTAAG